MTTRHPQPEQRQIRPPAAAQNPQPAEKPKTGSLLTVSALPQASKIRSPPETAKSHRLTGRTTPREMRLEQMLSHPGRQPLPAIPGQAVVVRSQSLISRARQLRVLRSQPPLNNPTISAATRRNAASATPRPPTPDPGLAGSPSCAP